MPPSLDKWPKFAGAASRRIEAYVDDIGLVGEAKFQILIGEMLVLKIAQILEQSLPKIYSGLVCGAPYLDGSLPKVVVSASTPEAALKLMEKHNRKTKSKRQLKWLSAGDINANVEFLIDKADHCFALVNRYVSQLDEIRVVRNEIAHSIPQTRKQFKKIVTTRYGSAELSSSVGKYVLTNRTGRAPIKEYAIVARTLINELCQI